jgi:hypothetical protein
MDRDLVSPPKPRISPTGLRKNVPRQRHPLGRESILAGSNTHSDGSWPPSYVQTPSTRAVKQKYVGTQRPMCFIGLVATMAILAFQKDRTRAQFGIDISHWGLTMPVML